MITGSITLNNLTDAQLVEVMQAKTANEGKLLFNPSQVVPNQAGTSPASYSRVVVTWNEEVGFRAALTLAHLLLGVTAAITKSA